MNGLQSLAKTTYIMAYSLCILFLFGNTIHSYTGTERTSHRRTIIFLFTDCRAVETEFSVRYFQVWTLEKAFLHIRQYNVLKKIKINTVAVYSYIIIFNVRVCGQ